MKGYHTFKNINIIVFVIFVLLELTGIAAAHRLHIDVEVQTFEVMEVEVEAYYGDGKAVKNGDITVYRASGDIYITGKTDSEGRFSFLINSTLGNETLVIEVEQTGHKATYEIGVSGNLEKISLTGGEAEGSIPTYVGVVAGFGYLLGLAGIASLVLAWRLKKQQRGKIGRTESQNNSNKTKRSIERHEPF